MIRSKKKMFDFSVIMTIYNIEKYLEEAILSVINQTLSFKEHIQIILVNDGSPDNSDKICKRYAKMYPKNIIYIEKENGGVSSARNAGLDVATGKIINFLDSDDYFSKNAFEKVKNFFDTEGETVDVVAINLINFENSCGSWVNGKYFEKTRVIDMMEDVHFMQCQVGASFIRREKAIKYRYDEKIKIHEDSQYLYKIFRDNPACGVISDATYWHRIRNNGTSATQTIKHKDNIFNMSGYLLRDLISFYNEKFKTLPSFLQTFIILEFNYYVIEKIPEVTFTNNEKKLLKKNVKNVIKNISVSDIKNHPFISSSVKKRYILLKKNINLLFNRKLLEKPEEYLSLNEKIKKDLRKIRGFFGKIKRYIKRKIRLPFSRSIKKIIELENSMMSYQTRILELRDLVNYQIDKLSQLKETVYNNKMVIKKLSDNIEEMQENISSLKCDLLEARKETGYDFENDVKYISYFHGGSGNRGCEALVKTIFKSIDKKRENCALITFRKEEDLEDGVDKIVKYIVEPKLSDKTKKIEYMGNTKFNLEDMGIIKYIKGLKNNVIALSIGGDNYCYGEYVNSLLGRYNYLMHKCGIKTALVGCSIEPELLSDNNLLKDLNRYDLIIARESLTYNALIKAGINKNTKLVPDTAFKLDSIKLPLPSNFVENKTIGINMSPLIQSYDNTENITYKNYYNLIKYILDTTQYNVALIPHVFWKNTDDFEAMLPLYKEFSHTNRVVLIGKHSAEELKGYISRCRIFIGARTHATIAAYSTYVPTLTIGYSVKSKGIAHDIFGTDKNYVIPVQSLTSENDLINAFLYIENNYDKIKKHLEQTIPTYIKSIDNYKKYIKELENKNISSLLPEDECTGCSACLNICPVNCIRFEVDNEGFKYPIIDYKKCIKCGMCEKVCPIGKHIKNKAVTKAYAMKSKDVTREKSSSGGVFGVLASYVLENNGIVYGAAFDKNLALKHIRIENKNDLHKLQGSKYLQSDINSVFSEIKNKLDSSCYVLFSGTPCQVKGLKSFLKKDYNNLITVDVVCHGVPSPLVFKKYKDYLEKNNDSKIDEYDFRNKDFGWKKFSTKIKFKNGSIISETFDKNMYMKGFLRNLYLRKSCYLCTSNNFTSGSDITLADYWGIDEIDKSMDDDKGTSLVLINSEIGEKLIENVNSKLKIKKTDLYSAVKYNKSISQPAFYNKNRKEFFSKIDSIGIVKNIEENLYDKE